MITSRGGMAKGRPGVQHGVSADSFWPSAAKAEKNTGFSVEGTRRDRQLCSASPQEPHGQGRPQPSTAHSTPAALGLGRDRGLAGGNRGVCDGGPRGCRLGVRSGVSGASAPGLRPRRPRPAPGSRGPGTPPGWGTTIAAGARVHTHVSWSLVTSTHVHGRAEQLQQGPSGLQSLHYLLSGPFPKKPADLSQ